MALPELSAEQRAENLERAKAARQIRARVRAEVAAGKLTPGDVIRMSRQDGEEGRALEKLKVVALLESVAGIGEVRAGLLLERLGIAESRRLRGLGAQQIAKLEAELG